MSATHARHELEPGAHSSTGWKRRPESGFGKKYVLFEGISSPRRATAKTSSRRGSRRRYAASASPSRPRRRPRARAACSRSLRGRGGRRARRRARLRRPARSPHALPVGDRDRPVVRLLRETRQRFLDARDLLALARVAQVRARREDAVRRENVEPRVFRRDHERHDARPARLVRSEGERRLVAMVAVGDEELRVAGERAGVRIGKSPEPRAVHLRVRVRRRALYAERAVHEQEQRLRVHAGLAQELEPLLGRPPVRPLVGQDDPRLVRLGGERCDDAPALAADAVRAGVLLDDEPGGRARPRARGCPRRASCGTGAPHAPPSPEASGARRCTGFACAAARAPPARSRRTAARRGRQAVRPRRSSGRRGTPARRPSGRAYQRPSHLTWAIDWLGDDDRGARRGPDGRGRVRGRQEGAPADAGGRGVPRARARRRERQHRGPRVERRRAPRLAFRPGRRRARSRTRRAVRRQAPAPGADDRAGRGRRPGVARPDHAPRRGRARRLPRVPRRGDLAPGARGARRLVPRRPRPPFVAPRAPRRRARTATTATPAGCSSTRSASRRSAARRCSSTRACAATSCSRRRSCTTSVGSASSARARLPADRGGPAAGSRPSRAAHDRGARARVDPDGSRRALHAVASHHDRQAARTAEAAVLYHANQLDAQAATRPVGDD